MNNINVLIKPVSGNCNMKCRYCFYNEVSKNRKIEDYGFMKLSTLKNIIEKALAYADNMCVFSFQGGEPTLIGLEFYEEVIRLQNKYNIRNIKIENTIQTNGLLVDEKWAAFLKEHNFLVGLSLDGYEEIHNLNRIDIKENNTYNMVMKCIDLFNTYKVEYNILSVVTHYSAKYAKEIYKYFKQNNFKYIQFIPCMDPINSKREQEEYSLTLQDLETFLKTTFDEWYEDILKGEYISIRYFDNLVNMILGYEPEACYMNGICTCNLVIEADGSVYPCDFYSIDKWLLGNINKDSISEIKTSKVAEKFISQSCSIEPKCIECKWRMLCRGGCRREREDFINNRIGLNYYCAAYKGFFDYAYDRLIGIGKIIVDNNL